MVLHTMRNRALSGNRLVSRALEEIAARLPQGWESRIVREQGPRDRRADAQIELRAPDGSRGWLVLEAKNRLEPKDVPPLASFLAQWGEGSPIVAAPYLSPRTRERLQEAGLGWVDLAGNLRVLLDRPALFLEARGADRSPWREERPARTLKGAKAGRIVRALCDFRPPLGVRELASKARTDPGYVSRVLDLLEREGVLQRRPRGPIEGVDWKALLRRWAEDYSILESNRTASYLEPRGLPAFVGNLAPEDIRYAVTGSLAASKLAPAAPARLAICYVEDAGALAKRLGLRAAEAGANVILAEPFDPVAFDRTWERDDVTFAAPSQVAADLLTSPGRGPAEAEELFKWMERNEDAWRA
jgi:hypothetical protein